MGKDLSLIFALISSSFGMTFGVEIGVGFFALAGSFLSIRFCNTKTTFGQATHVVISTFLAASAVGAFESKYPGTVPLRFTGIAMGLLSMLIAEKVYNAVRDTNITEKVNIIIDKVIAKWIP